MSVIVKGLNSEEVLSLTGVILDWDGNVYAIKDSKKYPIVDLPYAEVVERKKGKWINSYDLSGNKYKRCSECGIRIEIAFFANDYSVIFCPHCGADLREESNGES